MFCGLNMKAVLSWLVNALNVGQAAEKQAQSSVGKMAFGCSMKS